MTTLLYCKFYTYTNPVNLKIYNMTHYNYNLHVFYSLFNKIFAN